MTDTADYAREVRALLDSQRFAVLSTRQEGGHPYASLIAYWAMADLTGLVFCTQRSTRKYENLANDGRVALLVDNRSNEETDLQDAMAVTILGACREARGEEREQLSHEYLARHSAMADFVRSPGCAVMVVDARAYLMVTRFQNVIELRVREGGLDDVDTLVE